MNLRHGHRLKSINGGKVLKRKVTRRQQKHLLKMGPVYPDAKPALDSLTGRTLAADNHPHQAQAPAIDDDAFSLWDDDFEPMDTEDIDEAEAEETGLLQGIVDITVGESDDDDDDDDEVEDVLLEI